MNDIVNVRCIFWRPVFLVYFFVKTLKNRRRIAYTPYDFLRFCLELHSNMKVLSCRIRFFTISKRISPPTLREQAKLRKDKSVEVSVSRPMCVYTYLLQFSVSICESKRAGRHFATSSYTKAMEGGRFFCELFLK